MSEGVNGPNQNFEFVSPFPCPQGKFLRNSQNSRRRLRQRPPGHPHAACPRIWWGSEIPVDAYTYASSGRTANPKKSKILRLQRIWLISRQRDAGDMGISSHMVPRPETVIGGPKQAKNQILKISLTPPPEPYGGGRRWARHPMWGSGPWLRDAPGPGMPRTPAPLGVGGVEGRRRRRTTRPPRRATASRWASSRPSGSGPAPKELA